jgi:hypothetical protein
MISREAELIKSTNDQPRDRIDKRTNDQLVSLIFFIHGCFILLPIQHPYVADKQQAETALLRGDNTCSVKYGPSLLLWELRKQRWFNLFCWCNCCGKLPPCMQLESTVLWSHVRAWRRKLSVRQKTNEGNKDSRCSVLRYAAQRYRSELSECICVIWVTYS